MSEQPAGDRLLEATRRARVLGWRTITVARLARIAAGDETAMPPDPATAPKSAFGSYRPRSVPAP